MCVCVCVCVETALTGSIVLVVLMVIVVVGGLGSQNALAMSVCGTVDTVKHTLAIIKGWLLLLRLAVVFSFEHIYNTCCRYPCCEGCTRPMDIVSISFPESGTHMYGRWRR